MARRNYNNKKKSAEEIGEQAGRIIRRAEERLDRNFQDVAALQRLKRARAISDAYRDNINKALDNRLDHDNDARDWAKAYRTRVSKSVYAQKAKASGGRG